jgi:hypothetical protein
MKMILIPDYNRITLAENVLAFYKINFPQSTQISQILNITSSTVSTSISSSGDFPILFVLGIFVLGGLGVSVYVTKRNRIPEQDYNQIRVINRQTGNPPFSSRTESISKPFLSQPLVTFCSNCGNESEIGDIFCGNCGNRVIK